ncbi:UNVERIFIED_CONTAM: hypothetical protein Sradi_6114100 [Sesamum radiatum]|uniref:Uncharacterized protein n=1 Tax=Sesamum radiatum TaxID=300843 RepID=A0AAW2KMS9_SESRA
MLSQSDGCVQESVQEEGRRPVEVRGDEVAVVGGTPGTREQHEEPAPSSQAPCPQTSSNCECQQLAVGKEAEYSVSAQRPSPPQSESDDLRDRVQMIERYIRSHDPDWPRSFSTQPPPNSPAPNGNDEHAATDDHDLD